MPGEGKQGMRVRVKICGLTTPEDAEAAVGAGADAIGLVFWERSPRFVTLERAREIGRALPPLVARVGVFVDPSEERVTEAIAAAGLDTLQFHGAEPPEFCLRFGRRSIKSFRLRDASVLEALRQYATDAWLLDSFVAGHPGGTGRPVDWALAIEASRRGRPVILAGGLRPETVGEAIRRVRPYAVDVSSGVETLPGKKDRDKIRAFVDAVRNAEKIE